jgi:hypothetical protein
MSTTWVDWLWAVVLASFGVLARLGHMWSVNATVAGSRPVTVRDCIAALVAAPLLGVLGMGVSEWLQLPSISTGAMIGFLGLLGPGAIISAWEPLRNALIGWIKPKGNEP